MKITKQRLKEIIKEEINEASNPEWETADKILRDLVYLAQDLEDSSNAEPAELASAIVSKLREAVDAMERRLGERFAPPEDEVSDEEALVLKGPRFDPLGDSLPARRQRASVRRGK
tara:strand:+ start:266 stop:613 length:348 start_codon:yes stop_codon:yes gene_type:complete